MKPSEIEAILKEFMPEAESITVTDPMNDGTHLSAMIVSSAFEGKNRIARHRMIYSALGEHFDSGALHALQFKTVTPSEFE